MPQFTDQDPSHLSSRNYLWQSAKKNFYYRNDYSKARYLCNLIVSCHPFTEEADEAKLLLHDITIEILKSARTVDIGRSLPEKKKNINTSGKTRCLYYCRDIQTDGDMFKQCFARHGPSIERTLFLSAPDPDERRSSPMMPIAIAVVALPIIGIAKDGILGIAVPEVIGLVMALSVFRAASKIRGMVAGLFGRQRAQEG